MDNIFQPIKIGNIELKNRITFAPTTMVENGFERYKNIAKGGVSLITLEDVSVTKSMLMLPSIDTLDYFDYFRHVIETCHLYGCLVSAQLFHPEYDVDYISRIYNRRDITSRQIAHDKLLQNVAEYFDSLSTKAVDEIVSLFVAGAVNANTIGFDMIQIHGDRILGSSTSSNFNHRNDEYSKRTELVARVVKAIRQELPMMPIEFKFVVRVETNDYSLGCSGVLLSEVEEFINILDDAGVDAFNVALTSNSSIKDTVPASSHPYFKGEGCFLDFAKEVKKFTKKPVGVVGKLQTPSYINDILKNDVDYVGLSRQLIADPEWTNKVKEGRAEEISYCTYCNAKCTS